MIALLLLLSQITLSLSHSVGFAPLTVRATITVNIENAEQVCLEVDGGIYSSSCQPFRSRSTSMTLKDLPAGDYLLRAAAITTDKKVYLSEVHTLSVRGL